MKNNLNTLLQKEMTRKEFLATLGLGVATVMGLTTVLKMLSGNNGGQQVGSSGGYGASAYGGKRA